MTDERCEFCGRDPYHWVDIGVGFEPVAIVCCDEAIALAAGSRRAKTPKAVECEASQSGPEGNAQTTGSSGENR